MAKSVTVSTFEAEVLNAKTPVLVDFWAVWCGPCKAQEPIIAELEKSLAGKLKVVKVNVDEEPDLSQRFTVMSIPTLLLFKDGDPVETVIGVLPKSELETKIKPHL
ncbi:MAG: thioredoxin [bacterium]|nr:thioredoxin [bacterium]MDZ4247729.1 thioredoxin [Patescibacteria group bacterium]